MRDLIGRTLGHYRIVEKIGEGGMGEVYRAHDEKLDRDVAIKVLPEAVTQDAGRLARFETEAKAVAALNHPNIVTIHSVEEDEGVHFITMELVEGKTLSELIPRKGMPIAKLLGIAIPLANAVSSAHEQGIIHRDLKPDNLMVNDEGMVKILDFGLAKLRGDFEESGIGELPTQSATQQGRIVGTAAYMSPEQAEGKTIDQRSDIFSLGIVLYEMATGIRPFTGDSTASTLSAILKDTPLPITEFNPSLPRDLAKIVQRCLVKDPEHRYQTAKDLRNEIEWLKQEVDSGEIVDRAVPTPAPAKWKWIAVAAGVVAAAVVAYLLLQPGRDASAPIQVEFTRLTHGGGAIFPSLSPDGALLAYASNESGNMDVYLQDVGSGTTVNLTQDSAFADAQPAFSPDGRQIAFVSEREGGGIFLVASIGGPVRRLTDFGFDPDWSPDGKSVVFSTVSYLWGYLRETHSSQLWTINVVTEEKRLIIEGEALNPQWSPNGEQIAYWRGKTRTQRSMLTVSTAGGEPVQVGDDHINRNPVWSSDGKHLYFLSYREGAWGIWRLPIEERSGEVLGEPEIVYPFVSLVPGHLTISEDGRRLGFSTHSLNRSIQKVGFSPSTNEIRGIPAVVSKDSRGVAYLSVSPDGGSLACELHTSDIALVRSDGSDLRLLTNDSFRNSSPQWSPDGKKIAFSSDRSGSSEIWTMNRDGSGLDQLTDTPEIRAVEPIWSPDGQRMVYSVFRDSSYMFDLKIPWNEQTPQTIGPRIAEEGLMFDPDSWSPDGSRLAGVIWHEESNQPKGIAVYTLESARLETLTEFGNAPTWLNDSRRLIITAKGGLWLLDSESGALHELLSLPGSNLFHPKLSPDNLEIYFRRAETEDDIWMLTLDEER